MDDEYATMRQIDFIAERLPGTQLLKLAQCGHTPQRDQEAAVLERWPALSAGCKPLAYNSTRRALMLYWMAAGLLPS